jgi:hypothetical protein
VWPVGCLCKVCLNNMLHWKFEQTQTQTQSQSLRPHSGLCSESGATATPKPTSPQRMVRLRSVRNATLILFSDKGTDSGADSTTIVLHMNAATRRRATDNTYSPQHDRRHRQEMSCKMSCQATALAYVMSFDDSVDNFQAAVPRECCVAVVRRQYCGT